METAEFEKLFQKIEKRSRNTSAAKAEVMKLLNNLQELLDSIDAITKYPQTPVFAAKIWKWWGHYFIYDANWRLCVVNGKLRWRDVSDEPANYKVKEEDIVYINFKEFIACVREFVRELAEITDWEQELDTLKKLNSCFENKITGGKK